MRIAIVFICLLSSLHFVHAEDAKPLPPIKPIPRLLPPAGVEIPKEERAKLEARLAALIQLIDQTKLDNALRPDVEIYTKAVRWALDFDEFYDAKKDVAKAHAALDSAQKRLDELKQNKSSWTTQRGLLARGYRSDIDDSVQPYGLHIPANLDLSKPVPLLVWLHGRGDKETDLHFIATREKNKGEFAPDWCITLHPYGRGTIGFKFAGEIDVLDAIESVKKRYKIDDDRIALAGFSMGGAGAWHIGAHYADRFCVVHPGAGFVETAKYNKLTPDKYPSWYEQKLWGWYDVPNYTRNLFNVPVIAYSGEKDKQIQAAREMEAAFKAEGRELNHIIGPGFEHKYEPKAKEEILKQIKAAVDKGRDRWPKKVSLQLRQTAYCSMHWVIVTQVRESWVEARFDAELLDDRTVNVTTQNVKWFRLLPPWSKVPQGINEVTVTIDGQKCIVPISRWFTEDGEVDSAIFGNLKDRWIYEPKMDDDDHRVVEKTSPHAGSIDQAFMRPFLVVTPKGECAHPEVERWVRAEMDHLRSRWRATFRGDLPVKVGEDVTIEDCQKKDLLLWGDPTSNALIRQLLSGPEGEWKPDLAWTKNDLVLGPHRYPSSKHVPILIVPSPWASEHRYIVLNSGPTFREGHDRTNSQQTPKLPDWAIIGLDKDPDAFAPGEIKAAGFFDENWKVKAEEKK